MIERPDSFTPSNNSPEFLEEIFVQRHKLLEKAVVWSKDSIIHKQKKHLLFIGPRGSGKTHLISMIVNRLEIQAESQAELQNKMLIVWLGEDDIITNFLDLMSSILTTLVQTYPDQFHDHCLQNITALDIDAKAEQIMHGINKQLGDRTIVLVKENLSDVFRGLKDTGQKKFRSFLQEKRNTLVLASSQQLFNDIASRDAAFFGFFDTHHLKPLNLKEAMKLVTKLAEQKKDQKLLAFLKTPQGYFRLRALHYLAGGNHRLYIGLLDFLTMESFDNLVNALQELVVNLTPYFQERIRSLPPQQGKIIQKLCAIQGAVPVKELAAQAMIDERGAAKQLGELAKKKYVLSHKRGKLTYYEVAEPLMRFSLEVKNFRGKPLKMLVLLLRAWFSDNELQTEESDRVKNSANSLLSLYKSSALQTDKKMLRDMHSEIQKEMQTGIENGDHKGIIQSCNEILNAPLVSGEFIEDRAKALFYRGVIYSQQGEAEKEIQDYSTLIDLDDAPAEQRANALINRGVTYGQQGEAEKAIQDYSTLINLDDAPAEHRAQALFNRGVIYSQQGEAEKEIQDYSTLIDLDDAPAKQKANALINRGVTYSQQGEAEKEIQDYSTLIDLDDAPAEQRAQALLNRGMTYGQQGEAEKEIQDYSTLIDLDDAPAEPRAQALLNRGVKYSQQGEAEKEIQDYSTLIDLDDAPAEPRAKALLNRGMAYDQQGEAEKEIQDYSTLIDLDDAPTEPRAKALLNRGITYSQQGEAEKEIQDYSTLIDLDDAPAEPRAKALLNRGVKYSQQGEAEKAIQDYSTLIDLDDAPAEPRAQALLNRGMTYGQQGEAEKEIHDFNTLINSENIPFDIQNKAIFFIPEIYFTSLDRENAHHALEMAFSQGNKKAEDYPTNITDILVSIIGLGSSFWQKEIDWLLILFKKYGVLEHLGSALIKSVPAFVNDPSLLSSLEKWQLLWQKAGKDHEEMRIPLEAIAAMRLSIEQKTDKPLLRLPKEVRGLVQPLIADEISK